MSRGLLRGIIIILAIAMVWGQPLYFQGEMLAASLYWAYASRDMDKVVFDDVTFYFAPALTPEREKVLACWGKYRQLLDDSLGSTAFPLRVIVTTSDQLNEAVTGKYSLEASGAYQAGVVLVETETGSAPSALLHELAHHYVHMLSGGNYPVWYSEGIAQLMELRHLEYQWFDAIRQKDYYYSMEQLNNKFYRLPDQVSAYRQALGLVQLMEELGGVETHSRILQDLGQGFNFSQTVEHHTGLNLRQINELWKMRQ